LERAARRDLGQEAKWSDIAEHIRPHLPERLKKPNPFSESEARTLYSGWLKASKSLLPDYDWCAGRIRSWGGKRWDKDPEGPYEFIEDFITIVGDKNWGALVQRFKRLDQQAGGPDAKFKRVTKLRDNLKINPTDWGVRPKPAYRSKDNDAAILAFMNARPKQCAKGWSVSDLADKKFARDRGISIKSMTHHTATMRDRDPPQLEWADIGRWRLRPVGGGPPARKSCSMQALEKLYELPDHTMELYALTGAVGAPNVTWVKTLKKNGLVKVPNFQRGTLVKLTAKAVLAMKSRETIRDGRDAPLWQPDAVATEHRRT
jgi:hypothetical protein